MEYNPKKIEPKWQKAWEKKKLYKVKIDAKKPKWYSLFEFPYPSGAGLHVGHLRPYIGMDVISRKRRMEGYNVLFPIGWDAFGLPTENYAIKTGVSPEVATKQNTDNFRSQIEKLGTSLDWSREVDTTDPNYYKWTQWMFLKFFEKGMAYKAKTFINWCPKDKIGLANEEAAGGVCDRCGGPVEKREKEQWMISITKYADKLLDGLKDVDYIPQARIQQENWIGKSEGAEIDFQVAGSQEKIKVFTTRPDTIFGATYVVLSPEHWFIHGLINRETLERVRADQEIKDAPSDMVFPWKLENLQEVIGYVEETKNKPEEERTVEGKEKTGVELKGLRVINPATKEEIPVWVADYVLSTYGTGAIMAVPAHDERDFAFAKKYNLPIREVVRPIFIDKTPASGVKKDVEFVHRDAFAALVKHWSEDKYICLQWKKVDWRTLITGGAEQGEELVAAALREIKEETGYCDAKFVRNIGGLFDSQFYHVPKKVNRWAHMQPMYFELVSDKQVEVSSEEKEIHQVNWIPRSEVEAYLSVEPMKFVWNRFKSGSDIFTGEGVLVNSGAFNGVASNEAKKDIIKEVGGKMVSRYKLRDWVFSRQRYWGEPIPLVHCPKDGWVPVPERELPLKLPKVDRYQPTDNGESPLANIEKWVNTKCPKCKGPAKRETDTMPNWAGSSWYFLRYTDPSNKKAFASKKALEYFMPIDWYNGGMEHTVLHLLYSRFWNMFLYDLGLVPMSEPYKKRTSHGMILAHDGKKMSKSLGNVINPDDLVKEFGADALRLYEMFIGPFNQAVAWDERGILGCERFLKRVWDLQEKVGEKSDERVVRGAHQLVKKVSEDIEAMSFNTAVSAMMVFVNGISDSSRLGKEEWEMFIRVLAPFAPHLTEELWAKIGNKKSIHLSKWPEVNEKLLVSETFDLIVQVNGKMRAKITLPRGVDEKVAQEKALATDDVKKWITGVLKKTIFVKDRLINFIV